jgi:hypothetical protein
MACLEQVREMLWCVATDRCDDGCIDLERKKKEGGKPSSKKALARGQGGRQGLEH